MYEDKLLDCRWLAKSKSIKQRDFYTCTKCRSNQRLEVHHKIYVSGRQPWEYEDRYLVTLCNKCHSKVHENNPGINLLTKDKKIIEDSSIVKKKQKQYRKKWLRDSMSLINSQQ
jgi:5-methylcytosine-specific restriction endonuclease McrA